MSTLKIRIFCGIIFAFIYSAYLAYGELSYAMWGKTAEARLIDVHSVREGRGTSFQYSFTDGDKDRTETDIVKVDGPGPKEGTITIQYIPGDTDYSRIQGHHAMGGVYFFIGCLVVLLVFVGILAREANEPVRGRAKASHRR